MLRRSRGNMRPSALLPVAAAIVAAVLAVLCIVAGQKPGFMEDYDIVTLNTSQIGHALVDAGSPQPNDSVSNILENIGSDIKNDIADAIDSLAGKLGLRDFYSAHLLTTCNGNYDPASVPSAEHPASQIHKVIAGCTSASPGHFFDPQAALQASIDDSGLTYTLPDLNWPDAIDDAARALRTAWKAAFACYCAGIGLACLSVLAGCAALFSRQRGVALINGMIAALAFVVLGIASAVVTAVAVKLTSKVNQYQDDTGVVAYRGNKFLAMTWACTGVMLVAAACWTIEICFVGKRRAGRGYGEKY